MSIILPVWVKYSSIQATQFYPISSRSAAPYKIIPASLISSHSPYLFLSPIFIRGVVYVSFNILIRPDLMDYYTSSLIFSNIDTSGLFRVTSVKGLSFPFWAPFLFHRNPPLSDHYVQYVLFLPPLYCLLLYLNYSVTQLVDF